MKTISETRKVPKHFTACTLTMLIVTFMTPAFAQPCANSSGAQSASTFGSTALAGSSVNWSNLSFAQSSDGNYATSSLALGILSVAYSNYITAQGFNFSIPPAATICKILVDVEHSSSGLGIGAYIADQSVRILKNGAMVGFDLASGTPWPVTDVTAQYANSAGFYLWGASWTPADINNNNFGVAISAKIATGLAALTLTPRINQVRITVVYDMTVLGIGLQRFSVTHDANGNTVNWAIDNTPPSLLTIQRSADSKTWSSIANVDPSLTSYTDANAPAGATYYRMRIVSADGNTHYSGIALVTDEAASNKGPIQYWPNPFRNAINISSTQPLQRISITDIQGHILHDIQVDANSHSWQIATSKLPPGIYFLRTLASSNTSAGTNAGPGPNPSASNHTYRLIKLQQ